MQMQKLIMSENYTHFIPKISSLAARKRWIVSSLNSNGKIHIDKGAADAIISGKSLLAAGVIKIDGNF